MQKRKQYLLAAAAVAGLGLGFALPARAANVTWNGKGDGKWSNGADWVGGFAPNSLDALFFSGTNHLDSNNNDFPTGTNFLFSGFTFNSGAGQFTLAGNAAMLGGATVGISNGITNNSTNLQHIDLDLMLDVGNHSFTGGTAGLTLKDVIHTVAGLASFTPGPNGISTSKVQNTNGIIGAWATAGTDWATVDANNKIVAYTGYTDRAGGQAIGGDGGANYRINVAGPASPASGALNTLLYSPLGFSQTLDVQGTLQFGAIGGIYRTATSNNALTIGTTNTTSFLTAGGGTSLAGELILNTGAAGNTIRSIIVNSNIKDNNNGPVALVKTGQAAASLSGSNSTYSGGTFIVEGRLQATNAACLGAATSTVTVVGLGQAWLQTTPLHTEYTQKFRLAGIGTTEAGGMGAVRMDDGVLISGDIELIGNARISARNGTGTVSGAITGRFGIEFGGYDNDQPSFIVITNTNNAYLGNTTISQASTLQINPGSNGGAVIPHGTAAGNVVLTAATANLRTTVLDLNGYDTTINGLSRVGPISSIGGRTMIRNNVVNGPSATNLVTFTVGDNDANGSFDGSIQDNQNYSTNGGRIAFSKIGLGTQILGGTNTYTGGTVVNAGTLLANGPATGISILGGAISSNSATITLSSGSPLLSGLLIGQPVTGAGIPAGAVLTGITSTNTITISALPTANGSASLTFGAVSALGPGNVLVKTGAGFGGSGSVVGTVTMETNTFMKPGPSSNPGSVGTLTLGNLIVNGSDFQYDLVTPDASDFIRVHGDTDFKGASTITPSGGTSGTYILLTSDNPIHYDVRPTLNVGPPVPGARGTYTLDTTSDPQSIILTLVGGPSKALTWTGAIDGNWDLNQTQNWTDGTQPETFYNNDTVFFGDGPTNRVIVINATLLPGAPKTPVTINNSAGNDYSFTGTGGIGGTTGLLKKGNGNLTLAVNNTYSGATTISGGTLFVGNGGTSGALGTGPVTNNATLTFNRSDTVTVANVISGTGTLNQSGAGTLKLTATNTYTGDTHVNTGTLSVLGRLAPTSNLFVHGGGTLSGTGDTTTTGVAGNVTLFPGANLHPGSTAADGDIGALAMNGLAVFGGDFRFDLTTPTSSYDTLFSGGASFNAPSTFSFSSVPAAGNYILLTSSTPIALGVTPTLNVPPGPATFTLDTSDPLKLALIVGSGGTSSTSLTWTGIVSAGAGGGARWDINTTQNWSDDGGATTNQKFNNGDSVTFNDVALNRTVLLEDTVLPASVTVNNSAGNNYTISSVTGLGAIGGATTLTKSGGGTLTLNTNNTYTGATTINGGTLNVGSGGTSGSLGAGPVTNNSVLAFNRSDTVSVNNAISGAGTLNQNGAGILKLTGNNTYTGDTHVNAGTLSVLGTLASTGNVIVHNGGTLSGNGDTTTSGLVGNVTLQPGANLHPGATPADGDVGKLAMNSLAVSGGDFRFDLTTPSSPYDTLVSGAAAFNAASTFSFSGVPDSGSYTLLTSATAISLGVTPTLNVPSGTRATFTLDTSDPMKLALIVGSSGTNSAKSLTWTGVVASGGGAKWDVNTTQNWSDDGGVTTNQKFFNLDAVTFNDVAANRNVILEDTVFPASVTVNNSAGNDYTISSVSGQGAIAGAATLTKSGSGTLFLATNNTYTGATTVNGGLLAVGGSIANSASVSVNNGAQFHATATQTLNALNVNDGGKALVVATGAGNKKVLTVGRNTSGAPLNFAGTGTLDIADNGLVIDVAPGSEAIALANTRAKILAGYNPSSPGAGDGNWMGTGGITSSAAASDPGTRALGYVLASDFLGSGGGDFMGQTVDGSSILVRYTIIADANLDGTVGFVDLVRLAQNYGGTNKDWATGDFNYDGKVDFIDLVKLAQNYGGVLPAQAIPGASIQFEADLARAFAAVPEPASIAALGVAAAAAMLGRRRRRG